MKLTMENQLSFQKAMGYGDDHEAMTPDEVASQIATWRGIVSSLIDGSMFSDELTQLESFLYELSYKGEVEYEEPLEEYTFLAGFEYYKRFRVVGKSAEDARQMAKYRYAEYKERLPKLHDGLMLGICYLEDDVHGERIIEE